MQFVNITSKNGSMYVHQVRGVLYVSWVAKPHRDRALKIPADQASKWVKFIAELTGVACVATEPFEYPTRLYAG
jgi:hypothetical protein